MRLGDTVEVIDELAPVYRRLGCLVDLTQTGRLVLELNGRRRVEVDAQQVDFPGPPRADAWPSAVEALNWFAG